jgi:hypothetical protein
MNQSKLARDLQKAGASKREARDLSAVAGKINDVVIPHLSPDAKARIANDIGFGYNPYRRAMGYAWKGAAAFAVLMIIVLAQPAKPGSALYSVKRGTDKVKTFLQDTIPFIGDDDSNDDSKSSQQSERRNGSSNNLNDDSGNAEDIFDDNGGSSNGSTDDSNASGSNSGSSGTSGSNTSGSTSGGSGSTSGGSNSNSNSTGGGGTNSNGGGGSGGGHSGGVDDNPKP